MKQLKIIDQQPSENGIITCNFSMPIRILPGAQVTLDKLVITVNEVTGVITLLDQTILLQTNVGQTFHSVFIPGATYLTTTNFLIAMTQYLNNALSATLFELGLKIIADSINASSGNTIQFYFVSSALSNLVVVETLSVIDSQGIYIYSGTESGIGSGVTSEIFLQGGGVDLEFFWRPDIPIGGTTSSAFTIISTDNSNQTTDVEITQDYLTGNFSITSGITASSIEIPSNIFYPAGVQTTRYILCTQDGGFWRVSIYNTALKEEFLASYLTDIPWTQTKLYTSRFFFYAGEAAYVDPETNPGFGFIKATVDVTLQNPTGSNFTVTLNFTQAQQIKAGLGITPNLIVLTPQNDKFGTFVGGIVMNFSPFRTAGDLSLEMLSLPLENYEVGSSIYPKAVPIPGVTTTNLVRMPGARKNVLCYFRPQIVEAGTNIYGFANTTYQWLDLVNKLPVEFTSLDFKLFVSSTNVPVKAQSISFNILIKEKDEIYNMN